MPSANIYRSNEEDDIVVSIGRKIAAMRVFAGMTQSQLAEKVGIPQSNISRIESGSYNPTLNSLKKIAVGLNRKLDIDFI